jgi:hypothetical protein
MSKKRSDERFSGRGSFRINHLEREKPLIDERFCGPTDLFSASDESARPSITARGARARCV